MNWPIFGVTMSLCGLVVALFTLYRDAFKREVKEDLAALLVDISSENKNKVDWPILFIKFFDSIYSKRFFSWKRIIMSLLTSYLILFTIPIIVGQGEGYDSEGAFTIFAYGTIINVIPDYFSLQETRWVLKMLSKSSAIIKKGFWILVDFILTNLFYLLGVNLLSLFIYISQGEAKFYLLWEIFEVINFDLLTFGKFNNNMWDFVTPFLGLCYYTTFFTSIWLYLYLITTAIIKLWYKFRDTSTKFLGLLDVENQPFLSLGVVASTITFIIGTTLALIF